MKKNLVIFDGSNFYHGAKRLLPKIHLTNYNYRKLAEVITKNKNNHIEYCVGEIKQEKRNPKSRQLYAAQQKLFYNLEKQKIEIKKGYMLKNKDSYQEKGVDVRIALDILRGALKNEYHRCFLICSDTDIIPAITDAKKEGKEIIYIAFSNFVSRALEANCTRTIFITKAIIEDCVR